MSQNQTKAFIKGLNPLQLLLLSSLDVTGDESGKLIKGGTINFCEMLWVNRSSFAMAASKRNDGPDNNHCKFRQLSLRQKCWVGTILPAYRVKMMRNVGTHTTRHPFKRVIHLIEVSARLFWTLGNGLVISNINHLSPRGQAGHLSKKNF